MSTWRDPQSAQQAHEQWVYDLGVPHRASLARRRLIAAGPDAIGAVRRGLLHANPQVRAGCCQVLDHHLDEAAVPELIENLSHASAEVRGWALHALACDRCKQGACRPGEEDVIPLALERLLQDQDRHVRAMAAGLVGPAVHRRSDVLRAIEHAHRDDPHPAVRKVAGWYAPGGAIYRKLAPRSRCGAARRSG